MPLMTKDEFIAYAETYMDPDHLEALHERIAEIRSEIAMFGDSGPGSIYRLRQEQRQYARIATTYERLTGRTLPKFPAIPVPN